MRKTILEYAASAVFATHMETLLTKYLTLLTPTATLVNDGPPTDSRPRFLDSAYMLA